MCRRGWTVLQGERLERMGEREESGQEGGERRRREGGRKEWGRREGRGWISSTE